MAKTGRRRTGFFDLPYDVRSLIYKQVFQGRCYAAVRTTDETGKQELYLCSSHVYREDDLIRISNIPIFEPPDMRLLLTCRAFHDEASSVAKQLWLKTYQNHANLEELAEISDLVRIPTVESLGRLAKVRLLKEATLAYTPEQISMWGTFLEIVPPPYYTEARMVLDSPLVLKSHEPLAKWAAQSIDELDYLFYQGVLRTVRSPTRRVTLELMELPHFGTLATEGRWLIQDVWSASDPEGVIVEDRLRASIEWEGED